jgi:ribonuclease HI
MTVSLTAAGWIPKCGSGIAGWGCSLTYNESFKTLQGTLPTDSEDRSELCGIIAGLRRLKWPCRVVVYTANERLCNRGKRALRRKGSDRFVCDVGNRIAEDADLWKALQAAGRVHRIQLCWAPLRSTHKDCATARNAARSASDASAQQKARPVVQSAQPAGGSGVVCETGTPGQRLVPAPSVSCGARTEYRESNC